MGDHYQQGFNEGYIIAQHLPELAENISKIESAAPHIEGLKHGHKQFVLEQTREHRPAWMKAARHQPAPDPSKDRNIEPDR